MTATATIARPERSVTDDPAARTAPSEAAPHRTSMSNVRRRLIFTGLCLATVIVMMDNTILSIVIPHLYSKLHATAAQVQWAMSAYIIVYAVLLLPAGNLADRFGRRTFLCAGLAVFALGSIGAAWSGSPQMLIAMRVVQGLGGAAILPSTLSILIEIAPEGARTKYIATWSTLSGMSLVIGPMLAGWIVGHFWWGAVFLINVPLAVVVLAGAALIPNHRSRGAAPIDPRGVVLLCAGIAGVIYAVVEVPSQGVTNLMIPGAAVVGVVLLAAFVRHERSTTAPMLDIAYLRRPGVLLPMLGIGIAFGVDAGTGFIYMQYMQILQGRSALNAGMVSAVTILGWGVFSAFVPAAVRRLGSYRTMAAGVVMFGSAFLLLAFTLGDNHSIWWMVAIYFVKGGGMSWAATVGTDMIMDRTPEERYGVGSSLNDVARQVAAVVGVAVFGSVSVGVFHWVTAAHGFHIGDIATGVAAGNPAAVHAAHVGFVESLTVMGLLAAVVCAAATWAILRFRERDTEPVLPGVEMAPAIGR